MPNPTLKQRLEAGLAVRGWHAAPAKTSKYSVWRADHTASFIFVGTSGALRIGRSASDSRSIGDPSNLTHLYSNILADGDKALGNIKVDGTSLVEKMKAEVAS